MLEDLLVLAKAGGLPDLFYLGRNPAGEYLCDFYVGDLPDLLFELGTVILQERCAGANPTSQ